MRRSDACAALVLGGLAAGIAVGLASGLAGCTVGHSRVGNTVRGEPDLQIEVGRTTRADVLRIFGPPDRILRQVEGDAYLYTFSREEVRAFVISEPVVTRTDIYSWSHSDSRSDRLLILFDDEGRVSGYGLRRGTEELDR